MYTVGIDLGGTNIAAGICDENLNIIIKGSVPTHAERGPLPIVADMASLVKDLVAKAGIGLDEIAYVGIASPGSINATEGIVEYSNNILMSNFPMCEEFKKHLDVKDVYIANDANAAALGEALAGAARGAGVAVMITLGTGVGGGVIIDGKIFSGGINCCGTELGHTILVSGGKQCSCGRRGCWEAYSSATALIAMTKDKMRELELKGIPSALFDIAAKQGKVSGRTAFDAMRQGDKYGQQIVDEYVGYLAAGVANMINIFQPEVLSIGGGISNEKDYLLSPLTELVNIEQYTRDNPNKCKILIAGLGNDAGIIGAAGLGR